MLNLLLAEASVGAGATQLGAVRACLYALHQGGVLSCSAGVGVEISLAWVMSLAPSFSFPSCHFTDRLMSMKVTYARLLTSYVALKRREAKPGPQSPVPAVFFDS